ncbi:DNA cytosine methyltransferase [Sphingomonas soli]|uniref:DNA cytosine methyltransferase n=1 Tax=Sphingomonas soli TaxID=266127 RepID=UPI0008319AD5|nr:DNA cytosine methyltransferase [Sphingomonas soli]
MNAVELFAGAGGLGMGISKAGFTPERVVEWDRWCCDTIRENRKKDKSPLAHWPNPIEGDVRGVNFGDLQGKVDLVSGGPPCQPFSLGGKHRAHKDSRDMWPEAVRAVREIEPKAFIFENVKGLTRASFATYFSYIVLQLNYPEIDGRADEEWIDHLARLEQHHTSGVTTGLEYRVVPRVLNAANYGVPQRRERVVFVGFRSDLGIEWSFPDETHSLEALLWDQCRGEEYWDRHKVARIDRNLDCRLYERGMRLREKPRAKAWRTVRDAIADLPEPTATPSLVFADHRVQLGARSYPGHTGSPLDEAAKTLKAGVHGVPGGENMLARPDGSVRYFTVRESARLQTFPDSYHLHGSWSEAMRQLGNAVPVELARVIATNVASHLKQAA